MSMDYKSRGCFKAATGLGVEDTSRFVELHDAYVEAGVDMQGAARRAAADLVAEIGTEAKGLAGSIKRAGKAKQSAQREAARAAAPSKFDNLPDLADAIAKENGLPQAVSDAWMRSTQLGESASTIAADMGVGKSTVTDWVRKMTPLVDGAKAARYDRSGETVDAAATSARDTIDREGEEIVASTETDERAAQAEPEAAEQTQEARGDTDPDLADEVDLDDDYNESGDLADEDNPMQGQRGEAQGNGGVNISDSPYGEGKTSADNNIDKGTSARLAKSWDKLNAALPLEQQVAWKDLGSAQQDAFESESGKSPARIAKAHAELTALVNDGFTYMKAEAQDQSAASGESRLGTVRSNDPGLAATIAKFDALGLASRATSTLDGETAQLLPARVGGAAAPIAAAVQELTAHPQHGAFFTMGVEGVDQIVAFVANPEGLPGSVPGERLNDAAALYEAERELVAVNATASVRGARTDQGDQAKVASAVAHELTHAVDRHANKEHGRGGKYVSSTGQSITSTSLVVEQNGDVSLGQTPLMDEVVDFMNDAVLSNGMQGNPLRQLIYPLRGLLNLKALLENMPAGQRFAAFLDMGAKVARAEYRAQVEMMPTLVQLQLEHPELLLEAMPQASAAASRLLSAKTLLEAHNAFLGNPNENSAQHDPAADNGSRFTQPVAGGSEAGSAVRGDVRVRAADDDARRAGGSGVVPREAQARDSDGQPGGRARDTADRLTDADRLTPSLPAIAPASLKTWAKTTLTEKLYRQFPDLLGALSTDQLADRFSEHPLVAKFALAGQRMGGLANEIMGKANVVIADWQRANKALGQHNEAQFGKFLLDSTSQGMWGSKEFNDPAHDYLKPSALDTNKATAAEIAAYDAALAPLQARHAALRAQWQTLPDAYKSLFPRVEQTNRENFDRHVAADRGAIVASYFPGADDTAGPSKATVAAAAKLVGGKERTTFLKANSKDAAQTKLLTSLWESLDSHKGDYGNRLPGPYFPKSRFGDHIVAYKSADFRAAEKTFQDARSAHAEELSRATGPEASAALLQARKALAEASANLDDFKANESHYAVEFHETRQAAVQREAQLQAFFGGDGTTVARSLRDQFVKSTDGITPAYMNRIADHLVGSLAGDQADRIRQSVREMYLTHLPGSSALKNQMKRKNVPGVKNEEAIRAFSAKAVKDAYAISRKVHMGELHETSNALRYGSGGEDAKLLGNELGKRIALNATQPGKEYLQTMASATYFMQLGANPGFFLMNATQVWMNTAPMLAARHGATVATSGLARASADAAKLLKVSMKNSKVNFSLDTEAGVAAGYLSPADAAMIQDMIGRGLIENDSTREAGAIADGAPRSLLGQAAQMSNWPVKQLEVINRVSTALAAYRAEAVKQTREGADTPTSTAAATKYAARLIAETQMNYAVENRARFIHPSSWGGWGKIAFQFRSYQAGMAYLTLKNVVDASRGDKEALRAAVYMAGTQLAAAGLGGMPIPGVMMAVAGFMYAGFTDDDEEKDLGELFFQGLKSVGGESFATLVTRGVPAALGVDVSSKVGAGAVLTLLPYVRDQKDGRDTTAAYAAAAAFGPTLGLAGNMIEGLHQAGEGNISKAAGLMLPRGVGDILKGAEFQREGTKDARGNTILSADEITIAESAIKALGLTPTRMNRVQAERGAFFEARQHRKDARESLLREYAQAKIAGEDVGDVREKIDEYNSRNREAKINVGTLAIAASRRRDLERSLQRGVPVRKNERELYREVIGDEDEE